MSLTRRRLLAAGAASGAAIWLPEAASVADAASRRRVPLARGGGFASGVMSGDPGPRSVTLWTRLDDADPRRLRLRLEIATDEEFRRVVLRRDVPAVHTADHTAKVRVGGLRPDTRYWFRFHPHDPVAGGPHPDRAGARLPAADQDRLLLLPGLLLGLLRGLRATAGARPGLRDLRRRLRLRPHLLRLGLRRCPPGPGRQRPRQRGPKAARVPREVPAVPQRPRPRRAAPPRPARSAVGRPRGRRQLRRDAAHQDAAARRRRQRAGQLHRRADPQRLARLARVHAVPALRALVPDLPQASLRAQRRAVHGRLALLPRRPAVRRQRLQALRGPRRPAAVPGSGAAGVAEGRAGILAPTGSWWATSR